MFSRLKFPTNPHDDINLRENPTRISLPFRDQKQSDVVNVNCETVDRKTENEVKMHEPKPPIIKR